MHALIPSAGCLVLGALSCAAGYKIIKSSERKKDQTEFIGLLSPRAFLNTLGWLFLGLGLFVIVLLTPLIYLSH